MTDWMGLVVYTVRLSIWVWIGGDGAHQLTTLCCPHLLAGDSSIVVITDRASRYSCIDGHIGSDDKAAIPLLLVMILAGSTN